MSLAAINSQFNGLNGLSTGAYGFGGGLYTNANTDVIKDNIANSYDISATSSSYANKSAVSSNSFSQQCQTINYLLHSGRTEEAMSKYNQLYEDMAGNSYYQGYSENEIKTLLQEKYIDATGTSLVQDASNNGTSSFAANFGSALPGIGLLLENTSKDKLVAEVTGTDLSKGAQVTSAAGLVAGVGTGAAAGVGTAALIGKFASKAGKAGKGGLIIGAIAGAVASIGTWLVGKAKSSTKA